MRQSPYLPDPVEASIRRHIIKAVRSAVDAHDAGHEDEDTLTGHLGFSLRTGQSRQVVVEGQGQKEVWRWSMDYNKLRGRGPDATEKITGADGVFRFSINAVERNFTKSALFQSKTGTGGLQRLLAQSILLSTWKEAAFIIRYSRDGYTAFGIDEAMKQALRLPHPREMPLADWLMDVFVACIVGDTDLHYEHSDRVLRWRDLNDRVVHTSFQVRHALHLHVTGPKWQESSRGEFISTTDVHEHRMRATDEELLGVPQAATAAEVKRARKEAAKLYHVDRHQQLEQGVQNVLDIRMKEFNSAADRILVKLKK